MLFIISIVGTLFPRVNIVNVQVTVNAEKLEINVVGMVAKPLQSVGRLAKQPAQIVLLVEPPIVPDVALEIVDRARVVHAPVVVSLDVPTHGWRNDVMERVDPIAAAHEARIPEMPDVPDERGESI